MWYLVKKNKTGKQFPITKKALDFLSTNAEETKKISIIGECTETGELLPSAEDIKQPVIIDFTRIETPPKLKPINPKDNEQKVKPAKRTTAKRTAAGNKKAKKDLQPQTQADTGGV